ncbi:MAG: hypothetical protein AAF497_02720, partial [Planctomycetota bacterium]
MALRKFDSFFRQISMAFTASSLAGFSAIRKTNRNRDTLAQFNSHSTANFSLSLSPKLIDTPHSVAQHGDVFVSCWNEGIELLMNVRLSSHRVSLANSPKRP